MKAEVYKKRNFSRLNLQIFSLLYSRSSFAARNTLILIVCGASTSFLTMKFLCSLCLLGYTRLFIKIHYIAGSSSFLVQKHASHSSTCHPSSTIHSVPASSQRNDSTDGNITLNCCYCLYMKDSAEWRAYQALVVRHQLPRCHRFWNWQLCYVQGTGQQPAASTRWFEGETALIPWLSEYMDRSLLDPKSIIFRGSICSHRSLSTTPHVGPFLYDHKMTY